MKQDFANGIIAVLVLVAPPSAPASVRVIGISEESLTIEWSEAHSHGGAPITNYVIEKREGSSGVLAAWQQVATVTARTTSYVLQYLKVSTPTTITTTPSVKR
jgi:hypothetical protein